jgi:hypothetical protein
MSLVAGLRLEGVPEEVKRVFLVVEVTFASPREDPGEDLERRAESRAQADQAQPGATGKPAFDCRLCGGAARLTTR